MIKKLIFGMFVLSIIHAVAGVAYSIEIPVQCPPIPPTLQASVQRTLSSRPGDLFVVLKNGLTVLIRQKADADVVSAQVFVRTGSLHEGKYMNAGLSHYLEHVLAGGTTRSFTEAQAKERLQRMGGATNAYTSYDRTVFYITTSAGHWNDALDLLLSYVSENTMEPREVERERAVIQQEFKLGENNPNSVLWKLFMKTAYRVSSVRNPVIGYEEVFVKQNRDSVLDYYSKRYQPDNMVVAVAGNVSPSEVVEFISKKTAGFTRKTNDAITLPSEPTQLGPRWQEEEVPIARLTEAMLGFPSVTLNDRDLYALDVLALLLGQGESCRLYCRLKDQDCQVLNVHASNWTPSYEKGQFIISLSLSPQYWPGVLKSIEEEIDYFKKELATPQDLEKAKKSAIAQHVFGRSTAASQASSLAGSFIDTGDPYFDEAYLEGIRNVTPEEIRSVAQRYLLMDRINVAVVKPPASKGANTASAEESCPPVDQPTPVDYTQLKNGLKVLVKKNPSLPMVTLQLYGVGGLFLEGRQQPGLSALTASLLTTGTKTRTKLEIARAIENVGGSVDTKSEGNTYHVTIKVLKEDLELALDILSDIARNAQFPDEEIEKKRKDTLLAIQRLDENWQSEIVRMLKKSYFEKSPYEHDRLGTTESVNGFKREDIEAFYHQMVNPHHSTLAVYGDVDPSRILPEIQSKLEAWDEKPVVSPQWPDETHQISADRTIDKKNEKSSAALLIGANGLAIDSPDRPVLDVLDAVLAGTSYPGGRLFEALRGGKKDLVYTVGAFPFYSKNAGFFGVITQTTLGNLDKVQKVILDHLHRIAREPVPAQELATAKDMILTMRRIELESSDAQSQSAAVNEVIGLGWQFDQHYPDLIQAVTADQVLRLAKQLLAHFLIIRTIPEHPVEILTPPPPKSDIHQMR